MEKVIFLAQTYSDITSEPNLYTDLMTMFHEYGHEAFVVAPTLNEGDKTSLSVEGGVNVLRVPTFNLFGNSLVQKGISNVLLPYQYKRAIKKSGIDLDFDLVIMPTPPITLISVAIWLKKRSKGKFYLILRDIFPQNGVDLKILSKKGLPYRYFRMLEEKLYKNADRIGCMSQENINYIKRHNSYLDFSKLHLLPNWEEMVALDDHEKDVLEARARYGLLDKVVALYGGNIGIPQQLENIIYLAETVQDIEDLVFLVIGWGTQKERIIAMAKERKLNNVIFLDSVTRIEFSNVLKMADIGLISLNKDFTIPNYPSKVNAYYKFKIPVLATVDENTDFGRDQERIGCGFWSISGDIQNLKSNLLKLYRSKELREKMGLKGYEYMKNNLTPKHAYQRLINQF